MDDETPVRALARDILLGAGYRVLEAEDGEQALRVVEELVTLALDAARCSSSRAPAGRPSPPRAWGCSERSASSRSSLVPGGLLPPRLPMPALAPHTAGEYTRGGQRSGP